MRKISLYDERITKNPRQTITRGRELKILLKIVLVNEDFSKIESALSMLAFESSCPRTFPAGSAYTLSNY